MQTKTISFLLIPLVLSAFTHLWNPIGFPDFFSDEGVYLRRSLHVLEGLGPQETETYYDHPFFGQLFLAGIFFIVGYPDLSSPSDAHSIEKLFMTPRILMGMLAVIDTILVFKISERRYDRNVALVASVLFAVMPIGWFTRRILLESIQMPFILSSILFALHSNNHVMLGLAKNTKLIKNVVLVLASGICLGISIFTKIPAFMMIPLIAYLIFRNSKNWKATGIWFIPVILIPLIWPVYSMAAGQFNYWLNVFKLQIGREGLPLSNTLLELFHIDPVLLILTAGALIIAIVKKELFVLLWVIPNFMFLFLIAWGWAPYHLFIPLIPLFCIMSGMLIVDLLKRIIGKNIEKIMVPSITAGLGLFGLISITVLISTNVTTGQIQIIKFTSSYIDNEIKGNESMTFVSNPIYSWIFKYVYDKDNVLNEVNDFDYETIETKKILFISDVESDGLLPYSERLRALYNSTNQIFKIGGLSNDFDTTKYPYASMIENYESMDDTEVRICLKNCPSYD